MFHDTAGQIRTVTVAGLAPAESLERAAALGERLGLSGADLGRRFDRLSEGNMQKVSLIRAFSRRSPLLLLDEPFRGLDARAAEGLLGLIEETARSSAVLVSSHSPELLRRAAGRVLKLESGRLKGSGP